ncbi:hypothetical protein FXW78_07035 [Rhodococcus opacus]|nr:hypothetical protein [Rhodococcus opacus]
MGNVPDELLDYALWCGRRGHIGNEDGVYGQWIRDREAWSDEHDWPGGDTARYLSERAAVIPDEDPFDWSKI